MERQRSLLLLIQKVSAWQTRAPGYTRGGIRCLEIHVLSIPCHTRPIRSCVFIGSNFLKHFDFEIQKKTKKKNRVFFSTDMKISGISKR